MRQPTKIRTKTSARAGVPTGVPTPSKRTKPSKIVITMKQGVEVKRTVDGTVMPTEEPQPEKVAPKPKRKRKLTKSKTK